MSWATVVALTSKKETNVVQKLNNKWTDINTPLTFLSKYDIFQAVNTCIISVIAKIVSDYAIFLIDISWCDFNEFYLLKYPHKHQLIEKYSIKNFRKTFNVCNEDILYNDQNLANIQCDIKLKFNVQDIYTNTIEFYKPLHQSRSPVILYKISFMFLEYHIKHLFEIKTLDNFINFLDEIYKKSTIKLNKHAIEHQNKKKQINEIWIIWRKVFGLKFVYKYAKTMTNY